MGKIDGGTTIADASSINFFGRYMKKVAPKPMWAALIFSVGMALTGAATAVPILQLYIEESTYSSVEESWYFPGHDFRLWAIGNLTGPGGTKGSPITNVRLSVVYDDPGSPVTITLTPALIGGSGAYRGFTDTSLPIGPTWLRTVIDGSVPTIGGDKSLPGHGMYGAGKIWQEFDVGAFTLWDSQIADFSAAFPEANLGLGAQINAYDVSVVGADAHFDLYGQVTDARGRVSNVFAPPSHDATDGPVSVPIPGTFYLVCLGAVASWYVRRQVHDLRSGAARL